MYCCFKPVFFSKYCIQKSELFVSNAFKQLDALLGRFG